MSLSRSRRLRRLGRSRTYIRGLVALAVLLGVLVVADATGRAMVRPWIGRDVALALDLPERPAVTIGGFTFLPRLVSGEIPLIWVRMGNVTASGVTVRSVSLRLGSVRFSRAKFLSGHPGIITAATADGTTIIIGAMAPATGRNTRPITVRFARGRVLLSGGGLGGGVAARPSVSGRTLTLRPVGAPSTQSMTITLPALLPGLPPRSRRSWSARPNATQRPGVGVARATARRPCCRARGDISTSSTSSARSSTQSGTVSRWLIPVSSATTSFTLGDCFRRQHAASPH